MLMHPNQPSLQTHNRRAFIAAALMLLLGNVLLFLTLFMLQQYDKVCIDQFLFQFKSTTVGVHRALAGSAVVRVGLFSIAATMGEIGLYLILSGRMEKMRRSRRYATYLRSKLCSFFRRKPILLSIAALLLGGCFFIDQLDVIAYAHTTNTESDFIEDHYVDPLTADIAFPETKRNLVYIFLESMESTYADEKVFGADYIPELSRMARENVNFSHHEDVGGARPFSGTTWTAAAMVAQTSGMPVKVALTADAYGGDENFLPGAVSLGEILDGAGYEQVLLIGSDAEFHGREAYFTQHGGYTILDTEALKAAGRLPEDYSEWWGFEDEKLFSYAREELTRLAAGDAPFNLTLLTADTHFPDGYKCHLCGGEYEEPYANVLGCAARQVEALVRWIQQQPFYANTTIIISGDHLTMDSAFVEDIDPQSRTVFNCIINAPKAPMQEKNRDFGAFDMLPTTLSALGVRIAGDRLALGTDLFSNKLTLTEMYGYEALEEELLKESAFYKARILMMDADEDE